MILKVLSYIFTFIFGGMCGISIAALISANDPYQDIEDYEEKDNE